MAVESVLLGAISETRKALTARPHIRMLSAGYPDILLNRSQIDDILDADWIDDIPARADSAMIAKWHGLADRLPEIVESSALFARIGIHLTVIDVVAQRGGEIIADLNHPIDSASIGAYDIVLDSGTPEHVFHIGQALLNLANLVNEGGYIIQALPLNSFNHGFYNINPTLLADLYSAEHGFQLLQLRGYHNLMKQPKAFDVDHHRRFGGAPENSILVVIAKRTHCVPLAPFIQRKYRQ